MAMIPSVGDILMLSQTAWSVGRAFTPGKKIVPVEFAEVEREAERLSEALRVVAETLSSNASILDKAEHTTRSAISTILDSSQRTLDDLESFVARYRTIKPGTGERSWSDLVITNYKTLKWTAEGGGISDLRDLLYVHTNTINITMQALQSSSAIDNGSATGEGQSMHGRLSSTTSNSTVATLEYYLDRKISRQVSHEPGSGTQFVHKWRESSVCYDDGFWRPENGRANNIMDWDFESGAPPIGDLSIGDRYTGKPATTPVTSSPSSFNSPPGRSPRERIVNIPRRESTTLPGLLAQHTEEEDAEVGSSREASLTRMSPSSHEGKRRIDSKGFEQQLPPPAVPPKAPGRSHQPATPTSMFAGSISGPTRYPSHSSGNVSRRTTTSNFSAQTSKHSSILSSPNLGSEKANPMSPTDAQAFEKALFRNAAILSDSRVSLVEYAQTDPNEPDPRFDTEMLPVCKGARVFVIRKRENLQDFDNGGKRVVTSIWTISDDGEVRCQHKLAELIEAVPYVSFFEPEKVAVPPTGGDITLRLHATQWGAREEKDIRTKWVNYVFESEKHANEFQSAIFGRQLLGSFRTSKTTVIHEGFKGAFAFEEQFANIEVLRLWEDDGVNTPGGAGGVMALLHMSGNFGQGYAKWWINSTRQQVRVKDEHNKFAKLKGIDVRVLRIVEKSTGNSVRSSATTSDTASSNSWETKGKKGPERNVTGIRIEFKTEEERARFVDTVKRVQERMLPLPDI
ncbi:hypothetical protein MBLNU13_g05726t1 [Cladosporium sp. NU13]